ncbi:MAG: adenylate/guanylate cyclase domain-containing protein, partial [Desulfobacterales bacterium]
NASWLIDQYKANDLLGSDLVYGDATFVRNRVERKISPFKESRTKVKLFASTMFVDIVNFSSMMLKSDENLTVKMVDELIDRMYLIIYQHGGYIDKFLGDGFMAIFEHGKTIQQKTAFNTIKSAVDILRALKHKNYKLKKNYGVHENINVRIGISTGEIYALLLGNYIKTEFTYLGNSVNLASKLESQAASHYMLIDEDTNLLLKNLIRSTPEQVDIPGLGKTNAYRVIQLARTAERPFNNNRTLPDGKA